MLQMTRKGNCWEKWEFLCLNKMEGELVSIKPSQLGRDGNYSFNNQILSFPLISNIPNLSFFRLLWDQHLHLYGAHFFGLESFSMLEQDGEQLAEVKQIKHWSVNWMSGITHFKPFIGVKGEDITLLPLSIPLSKFNPNTGIYPRYTPVCDGIPSKSKPFLLLAAVCLN